MAVRIIEESSCDFCDQDAVDTFTLSNGGRTVILDTCAKHAGPYLAGMEAGSGRARSRTVAPVHKPTMHAVIPVD